LADYVSILDGCANPGERKMLQVPARIQPANLRLGWQGVSS
jgi:hypothetical protein